MYSAYHALKSDHMTSRQTNLIIHCSCHWNSSGQSGIMALATNTNFQTLTLAPNSPYKIYVHNGYPSIILATQSQNN